MFVAADSADTGKSRLWKPSGGPGRWVHILHSSVIPLKLRSEKGKLRMLVPPSKPLVSALHFCDSKLIESMCAGGGGGVCVCVCVCGVVFKTQARH